MKREINILWIVHTAGALIVLVASALLYVLVISPIWHEQREQIRLRADLITRQTETDQYERSCRATALQVVQAREAVERATLQLKSPSAINEQLAKLVEIATREGVQIDSIQPGAVSSNTKFRTLSIQLSGKGRYGGIYALFENVRKQCPDTSIRSFNLVADHSISPPAAMVNAELVWITSPEAAGVAGAGAR